MIKRTGYTKKVKELEKARDLVAKQVGEHQQSLSSLKSELAENRRTMDAYSLRLAVIQKDIADADKLLLLRKGAIDEIEQSHASRIRVHQSKEQLYIDRLTVLEAEIEKAATALAYHEMHRQQLEDLTPQIDEARKLLLDLKSQGQTEQKLLKGQQEQLQQDRESFESVKQETDARATQNTKDHGEIEIFVRRLQKFYDESGINMSILSHFNLKKLDDNG